MPNGSCRRSRGVARSLDMPIWPVAPTPAGRVRDARPPEPTLRPLAQRPPTTLGGMNVPRALPLALALAALTACATTRTDMSTLSEEDKASILAEEFARVGTADQPQAPKPAAPKPLRSEEHTSELQSR